MDRNGPFYAILHMRHFDMNQKPFKNSSAFVCVPFVGCIDDKSDDLLVDKNGRNGIVGRRRRSLVISQSPSQSARSMADLYSHASQLTLVDTAIPDIFRCSNHSARFTNAYRKGLTGTQAVRSNRKYHGHQTLPPGANDSIESH